MDTAVAAIACWLLLHASIGYLGTALARRYALQARLLDEPGDRRSHAVATPRGGGIAIVSALLVGCGWLAFELPSLRLTIAAFAAGLVLVAGIGWIDDHRPLSPWARLAVHVLAGACLALAIQVSTGRGELAIAAAILAVVLTNVWNFMDGIDGLAASQAALIAAGLAFVLPGPWVLLAAGCAAAVCGFLPWNLPRARIFLGDVGSGALGYVLAALLVLAVPAMRGYWPWLALPVSAFAVDAGLTLARRALRGERWWTAHTQHTYQAWARRAGHLKVTLAYGLWTAVAVLSIMAAPLFDHGAAIWIVMSVYVVAVMAWSRLGAGRAWHRTRK